MTNTTYYGYQLHCDTCGDRMATFSVDTSSRKGIGKLNGNPFERQEKEVTKVLHNSHNWHYTSTIKGVSLDEFKKWESEND